MKITLLWRVHMTEEGTKFKVTCPHCKFEFKFGSEYLEAFSLVHIILSCPKCEWRQRI